MHKDIVEFLVFVFRLPFKLLTMVWIKVFMFSTPDFPATLQGASGMSLTGFNP